MTTTAETDTEESRKTGPLGRLGGATATHRRWVFAIWALLVIGLGAFAPSVFNSLAGAGWQANGSESVAVRELAEEHFGGNSSAAVQVVVHSDDQDISSQDMQRVIGQVTDVATTDDRFGAVVPHQVAAVVATCLLDVSDPAARAAATRYPFLGRPAPAVLRALDPALGRLRVPIRWLADMTQMSTDPALSRLCAADPRGGGASVPLGFVSSWMSFRHTASEDFTAAPVTLVAPTADTWTPPELSIRFLQRVSAPTTLVTLENCGHYPIEEPGLDQLRTAMLTVRDQVAAQAD
ncbi:hypothetical protein [Mycolicibacterium poriferae]|uniref:hypothetical protein n=1 Tax=Mycolicibacterium poriferae TaxID=39694 RepID=UPI00321A997A